MATNLKPQTTLFPFSLLADDLVPKYFSEEIKATRNQLPQAPSDTFTLLLVYVLTFLPINIEELSTIIVQSLSRVRLCSFLNQLPNWGPHLISSTLPPRCYSSLLYSLLTFLLTNHSTMHADMLLFSKS